MENYTIINGLLYNTLDATGDAILPKNLSRKIILRNVYNISDLSINNNLSHTLSDACKLDIA